MTEETNQPTDSRAQPELKQVLGALVFAARKPIAAEELRGVLDQVAQSGEDAARSFGKIQESDIRTALEQLKAEYAERKLGLILVEVAGGLRFQTDPTGGPWVRQLLNLDKPARLSKPALETLAIIAYRQPATRAEIEALRGVNVDAMMRHLLELQLIRIVGRSELPGRPLMYGTTQLFLEHFGLGSVKNLPGVEQLSRRDAEHVKREADAGRHKTEDGHQTPDAGPDKTAAGQQPSLPLVNQSPEGEKAEDGRQTPDTGPENKDGTTAEANVQHPTSNAQLPMEEQRTDDGRPTTDDRQEKTADGIKTDAGQQATEKDDEGGEEEESDEDEDEYNEDDDDEDKEENEDEDEEERE